MDRKITRSTTDESSEPRERRPYVKPGILEEEKLKTYTLACEQPPIEICDARIATG